MDSNKIFVVIPAYNEEKNIGNVIEGLLKVYNNVIAVDDCSTDLTREVLKRYPIRLASHIVNLGQGAALQTGDELALKLGADIIVHFDADGQHRVDQIEKLISPIRDGRADIVFGSRFIDNQSALPWAKRHILLPIGRIVNWLFSGLKLTDAHNGYRAMNRKAAEKIILTQNRMAHATEILGLVKKNKLRYTEVPVVVEYKEFGQGFLGGLKIVRDLILKSITK
ncbi:MAG: glycosyltransferase family 2 protein [Patescibacteria group bacterium]|nr:glycosyltransferase family 2 protein [Patescibacteria group bacterium]